MQLPYIENADHVSCRFANSNDPLPTVDIKDVTIELLSRLEIQITNHSKFRLARVEYFCRGPELTTSYLAEVGWSPDYTSRPHTNVRSPGYGPVEADECWINKVEVMRAQNLNDLRRY